MNPLLKMIGLFCRFSLATGKNENTNKSTVFWMRVWRKWCFEKKNQSEIQNIPLVELDILLERSYAEVKNKDGNDYKPDSLMFSCILLASNSMSVVTRPSGLCNFDRF